MTDTRADHLTPTAEGGRRLATTSIIAPALALLLAFSAVGCTGGADGSSPNDPKMAVATERSLTTELRLSTTTPAAGETVSAQVTVTNNGSSDAVVPSACRTTVFVRPDAPVDATVPTASVGSTGLEIQVQNEKQSGVFASDQDRPELTLTDLDALIGGDAAQATQALTGCGPDDATTTLPPGESFVLRKNLVVGELDLPAGPGVVATKYFGASAPPDAEVPVTIPEPARGSTTRAAAIDAALALPEVRARIATLEGMPPSTSVVESTSRVPGDPLPPAPSVEQFPSLFVAWPLDDGWQVGYADPSGAFLVRVAADGTATLVGLR